MNNLIQANIIPATGDNLGWLIWLIVAILVLAAIAVIVSYIIKKKRSDIKMENKVSKAKHSK